MSANHNYLIVDGKAQVLWLRAVSACTPRTVLDAFELVLASVPLGEPCFIAESFESPVTGKEISFQLVAPYLRAKADGSMLPGRIVEVWHRTDYPSRDMAEHFGQEVPAHVNRALYTRVIDFVVGGEGASEDALNTVYRLSQNLDHSWHPGQGKRSSSVGDIFVVRQGELAQAWRVMPFGFGAVTDFSESTSENT